MKKNIIVSITIAIITIIAASFTAGAEEFYCATPEDALVESALGAPSWTIPVELDIHRVYSPSYGVMDNYYIQSSNAGIMLARTVVLPGDQPQDVSRWYMSEDSCNYSTVFSTGMSRADLKRLKKLFPISYRNIAWNTAKVLDAIERVCWVLDDLYLIEENPEMFHSSATLVKALVADIIGVNSLTMGGWNTCLTDEVALLLYERETILADASAALADEAACEQAMERLGWYVLDVDQEIIDAYGYQCIPRAIEDMPWYDGNTDSNTHQQEQAYPIPEEQLSEEENLSEEEGLVEDGFVGLDIEAAEEDLGFIS